MSASSSVFRQRDALALALAFACGLAVAAPNKAPTVTLTAPASGATFAAPATITLSANASDADGTIAKVEFFHGTSLIGTRTTTPYSVSWTNVPAGSYSLSAKATDDRGGTKTSTAVGITVSGPRVVITSPANAATIYAGSVVVTGTFSGDASTTVLVDNGNTTRVATLDGNGFSATMPVHVGTNTLRVVANRRDRTSDQASINVTGNANPLLVFTGPAVTTFDAPASVGFVVDAVSPAGTISRVDFYRNGNLFGTTVSPPYEHAWTNIPSGTHNVSAIATDALGVTGSALLTITVNGANAPPVVTLTSPTGGTAYTAPASISMTASAADADGSVALVEFLQNGHVVGTTNVPPYNTTWSNAPAGAYALTARATDNRSAVTTSTPVNVTVVPPNNTPSITLTSPAPGAVFVAPATIALSASAADSDGTVTRVEYFSGATLIGTAAAAPWNVSWTGAGPGSHSLVAKATDNLGASATSTPVVVTVNANQPPTVSLVAPSSGATYDAPATISLSATAADSDGAVTRVDFYVGATLIATATTPPYAAGWTAIAAGAYALTAQAIDDLGAIATSAPVTVSVNAPSTAIDSPTDGATINSDSVSVTGTFTAPPNSGITVNGRVAALDATGRFYASQVPLAQGANTISVTLTTLAGFTATQTITVTGTGPAPVRVSASPTQGVGPLDVAFEVTPGEGTTIQKVEFDLDTDGSVDRTLLAEPWSLTASYAGSGAALATIRVTDTQGVVYTETIPIVLANAAALDQDLQAAWRNMTAALASGDRDLAMRYLDTSARRKYGPVFDALQPYMPQIVASFSAPQPMSLSDGLGEYAINRIINGENRIFLIYFNRGGDGIWRLGSM